MDLLNKKCIPCEGGVKPLTKTEAEKYLAEIEGWKLNQKVTEISKEFKFQDFIGAINFVDKIAEVAEAEGHHPDVQIHYNKVLIELATHSIGGLSENDFILAAKIDASK